MSDSMSIEEAREVLRAVRHETYPPTNLYVLMAAVQTIYLNRTEPEIRAGIADILDWALSVFERNG